MAKAKAKEIEFQAGDAVRIKDLGVHSHQPGEVFNVSRIKEHYGDPFVYIATPCKVCKLKEGDCGGWYASHFELVCRTEIGEEAVK